MAAKVYENGAWRDVNEMDVYENGAWRKVYPVLPINVIGKTIGDEVIIPHKVYGNIPFIIIGKDHDAPDSVTLISKGALQIATYDMDVVYDSNGYIIEGYTGESEWDNSMIRFFLNSIAPVGSAWYSENCITCREWQDSLIYNYTKLSEFTISRNKVNFLVEVSYEHIEPHGFLGGFSEDIRNQIIEVPKGTYMGVDGTTSSGNYIIYSRISYEKVFLLSFTELGLDSQFPVIRDVKDRIIRNKCNGEIYEYFKTNTTACYRYLQSYGCMSDTEKSYYWTRNSDQYNYEYNTKHRRVCIVGKEDNKLGYKIQDSENYSICTEAYNDNTYEYGHPDISTYIRIRPALCLKTKM